MATGSECSAAGLREGGIWVCKVCGWTHPNAHPSAKHRRNHKKVCTGRRVDVKAHVDGGSLDEAGSDREMHAREREEPSKPREFVVCPAGDEVSEPTLPTRRPADNSIFIKSQELQISEFRHEGSDTKAIVIELNPLNEILDDTSINFKVEVEGEANNIGSKLDYCSNRVTNVVTDRGAVPHPEEDPGMCEKGEWSAHLSVQHRRNHTKHCPGKEDAVTGHFPADGRCSDGPQSKTEAEVHEAEDSARTRRFPISQLISERSGSLLSVPEATLSGTLENIKNQEFNLNEEPDAQSPILEATFSATPGNIDAREFDFLDAASKGLDGPLPIPEATLSATPETIQSQGFKHSGSDGDEPTSELIPQASQTYEALADSAVTEWKAGNQDYDIGISGDTKCGGGVPDPDGNNCTYPLHLASGNHLRQYEEQGTGMVRAAAPAAPTHTSGGSSDDDAGLDEAKEVCVSLPVTARCIYMSTTETVPRAIAKEECSGGAIQSSEIVSLPAVTRCSYMPTTETMPQAMPQADAEEECSGGAIQSCEIVSLTAAITCSYMSTSETMPRSEAKDECSGGAIQSYEFVSLTAATRCSYMSTAETMPQAMPGAEAKEECSGGDIQSSELGGERSDTILIDLDAETSQLVKLIKDKECSSEKRAGCALLPLLSSIASNMGEIRWLRVTVYICIFCISELSEQHIEFKDSLLTGKRRTCIFCPECVWTILRAKHSRNKKWLEICHSMHLLL